MLSCPYPPSPFPSGEGDLIFLCKGLLPLASPVAEPGRHFTAPAAKHPAGWLVFFPHLPTLLFSLPSCPLSPLPFPSGEGDSFLMQGAPPCIPVAEPGRHLQPLPSKASGGVAGFLPRPTPRQPSATPAQINAAPPPVNTIIEESSWGFGGFLQEAPDASSLPRFLASRFLVPSLPCASGRTVSQSGGADILMGTGAVGTDYPHGVSVHCCVLRRGAAHRHQPEEE